MKVQKRLAAMLVLLFSVILFPGNGRYMAAESGTAEDPEYWKAQEMQEAYIEEENSISATGQLAEGQYKHNDRYANSNIYDVIDVSVWQGEIDWKKVKASGVNYAFIRAGYRGYGSAGTLMEDTNFSKNYKNARNAGVQVGVYIYSQAITADEARAEADFLLSRVKSYELGLPVVIDYEYASVEGGLGGRLYNAKLSRSQATDVCKAFCDKVSSSGLVPMVYANRSMLETNLKSSDLESKYKVWLAEYNTTARYQGFYEFWQYSEKGTVDGINGYVDSNFWYSGSNQGVTPPNQDVVPPGSTPAPDSTDTVSPVKPGKPAISSAVNKRGKKVYLKWKKVKSIKGYQICYSTNKNFKSSKKVTIKGSKTSATITKLKKNKTYYFKVRAYKLTNEGSKLYGFYGSTKKVKIKK